MATKITVSESDIVVTAERAEFGLPSCRSIGRLVKVLDQYELAQFRRGGDLAEYVEICGTCSGTGFRPEFAGLFGGQCFPCRGTGLHRTVGTITLLDLVRKLRRREAEAKRRDAKRAAERNAKADALAAWLAERPELAERLAEVRATIEVAGGNERLFNPTTRDIASKTARWTLSDAQVTLFDRLYAEDKAALAERQAKAAARGWIGEVNDKVTFTGKLIHTAHSHKEVAWNVTVSATLYTLVAEDGTTVKWWRSGYFEPVRFEVYTVTGTVKKLENSAEHGKATVITRAKILEVVPEAGKAAGKDAEQDERETVAV